MTAYILLALGLLLVFLEFYTPGGILAVGGAVCIIMALVIYLSSSPSFIGAFFFVTLTIAGIAFVIWFALRRIKKSADKDTFYLSKDQEGYVGAEFDKTMLNKQGIALTDLGPSGYVLIEGNRYQALCRGTYLDKGQAIEVIGGEGAVLIVKPQHIGK